MYILQHCCSWQTAAVYLIKNMFTLCLQTFLAENIINANYPKMSAKSNLFLDINLMMEKTIRQILYLKSETFFEI